MSRSRDILERLVQQTVRNVLFRVPSDQPTRSQAVVAKPTVLATTASSIDHPTALKTATPIEIRPDSLLHLLVSSNYDGTDNPAEDDGDNNAVRTRCGSWITDCVNWSVERLQAEKAEIKRYLHQQRRETEGSCQKTMEVTGQVSIIHEAYAILKLFLLERDPDYRQCLQQTIGGSNSFLTSLHVLLTLYATCFERAHGRQISKKADVKPIETLYELFLAHHCAPKSQ
ncbi:uncharacterized protein IUM83_01469 [Phytophthora cinnamomi]|uniref:uncharacterized protein n=1 Tax=Phytophthora cinnamomi TaxID=4785 RepID=UPI0035593973|nr:hypothetical protein IUM83_01469 [Phytophthora cinnamomi]